MAEGARAGTAGGEGKMQNFIAILTPTNKIAVLITANFAKISEMCLLITLN